MTLNPMRRLVQVVIVGAGKYGRQYLDTLLQQTEKWRCHVAGVVDPADYHIADYKTLKAAGIPLYPSLPEFYRTNAADLCCIAAPIEHHVSLTACAMMHGSHVLCEVPVTGNWHDIIAIEALSERTGLFFMPGYQWCCSEAILSLKKDILSGIYGLPVSGKTMMLCPTPRTEFESRYTSKWKNITADNKPIYDNAINHTVPHLLQNLLYLFGPTLDQAQTPSVLDVELIRANTIESYDTALFRAHFSKGMQILFITSFTAEKTIGPKFELTFTQGTVTYDPSTHLEIRGTTKKGTTILYGDPCADEMRKLRIAVSHSAAPYPNKKILPCTARTAIPHTKCLETLRYIPVAVIPQNLLKTIPSPDGYDVFTTVSGLDTALFHCYRYGCLLCESIRTPYAITSMLQPVYDLPTVGNFEYGKVDSSYPENNTQDEGSKE